jgi:hypothetical protein
MLAFLVWPLEGLGNIHSSYGGVFDKISFGLGRSRGLKQFVKWMENEYLLACNVKQMFLLFSEDTRSFLNKL